MPSLPYKRKGFLIIAKNCKKLKLKFSRSALFRMKIRVFLKYFVHDCLWKQVLTSNLLQASSNLIFLEGFITIRPLTQFHPKLRASRKVLNFAVLDTTFPIFSVRPRFGIKWLSSLVQDVFRKKRSKSQLKNHCF